jgi:hypothetical protein
LIRYLARQVSLHKLIANIRLKLGVDLLWRHACTQKYDAELRTVRSAEHPFRTREIAIQATLLHGLRCGGLAFRRDAAMPLKWEFRHGPRVRPRSKKALADFAFSRERYFRISKSMPSGINSPPQVGIIPDTA